MDSGFLPNIDFFEPDENEVFIPGNKDIFIIGDAADKGIESDFLFVGRAENSISTATVLAEHIFTDKPIDFTPKKEYNPQLIIDELFNRFNVNAGIV